MKQENDPVLAAIDKAKWDDEDLDAFNILSNCDRSNALLGANRQIEAIRTAYLASKQQPSDGGAFERVIAGIPFAAVKMFAGDIADITDAHNADRAADKQRIAELEEQLKKARGDA